MATIRQNEAIEKCLKTSEPTGKIMRESGYSESSSNKPKILTDSKAYKELVDEAKRVVADIMRSGKKDDTRLKAAQDIIDRSEGKATQRQELSGDFNITLNYKPGGFEPKLRTTQLSEGVHRVDEEI